MLPFQDTRPFQDRLDAGKKLAQKFQRYANRSDVSVFALPRGGVPVAYEVALALNAPMAMDVFIVSGQPAPNIYGRIVIIINDGETTGESMRAAVAELRAQSPKRIVAAVPTAAPEVCKTLEAEADETICLITPEPFLGADRWYADFSQTTDEEVMLLLEDIRKRREFTHL